MTSPGEHSDSPSGHHGHFVTTHWSVVQQAGGAESCAATAALGQLCRAYWYPLYAYIRRQGHRAHDAEDLTQAFFARLLDKNYLAGVRQEKGRFRTFLLTALKRFLANEWDRAHAQKRGGFAPVVSIDQARAEAWLGAEPVSHASPDRLFDRHWAMALLEGVMGRLRAEYEASGRSVLFDELQGRLGGGSATPPYAEIGARLHLTEAAVKMAVQRLRARYRQILREEISHTVSGPEQVEEELRCLFDTFEPRESS